MFRSVIECHRATLEKVFARSDVALLSELQKALGVQSRTTVFFVLKAAGYFTSYSHAGRYYTLRRVPKFDAHGLWFAGDVRFSKHRTLRATVVVLVRASKAGLTHEELREVVGLRVHDTLRSLVEAHALGREEVESLYVYLDVDPKRAAVQLEERRRNLSGAKQAVEEGAPAGFDSTRVIEVLVAVIRAPKSDAHAVAVGLRAAGSTVSDAQVEAVFARYGLGKKTVRSQSPRSRR